VCQLFLIFFHTNRGIHLCGSPDWDFLLNLDLDILSMNIYTNAEIFSSCAGSIKKFLDRGGVLVWGIVPTGCEIFAKESLGFLFKKLEGIWQYRGKKGIDLELIVNRSMLSPATCCLVNPDKGQTVENAFSMVNHLSHMLRGKYKMIQKSLKNHLNGHVHTAIFYPLGRQEFR
jgi:hypothetical protein